MSGAKQYIGMVMTSSQATFKVVGKKEFLTWLLSADACVSITTQIEATLKTCEADTSQVGQDYYTALNASGPAAAKRPPSGAKSPAPAKGQAGKDEPTVPSGVSTHVPAPSNVVSVYGKQSGTCSGSVAGRRLASSSSKLSPEPL